MQAKSAYSHMMQTGDFEEQKKLVAQRIDERSATLQDGTKLRVTPAGQKTVDLLVRNNDIIKTSYNTGGKVIDVLGPYMTYGLPWYTIVYVGCEAVRFLNGNYKSTDQCWINECVAQDDRILMLFEASNDEVFITQKAVRGALLMTVLTEARRRARIPISLFL